MQAKLVTQVIRHSFDASQGFIWPADKASVSLLYPLFEEIRTLSNNYTVLSNVTNLYPSVTAAIVDDIGPIADAGSFYGASTQLASRFVPRSMLESSESIQKFAEAIWKGVEIGTALVEDHLTGALNRPITVNLFGTVPAATRQQVNETGANPGSYAAAWHVVYSK